MTADPGQRQTAAGRNVAAMAYMSTVAEVTSPTRPAQLGNGRNISRPITKQKTIDTIGTPRLLI